MKSCLTTFLALFVSFVAFSQPYKFQDQNLDIEDRIEDLLGRLTLEEKVHLLHGKVTNVTPDRFESGGVERLGVKQIEMLDGPVGVRDFDKEQKATSLPSTLSLSCTWDVDAASKYGEVLASEMLFFNKHVLFGPGVNLMKSPLCGRNFEYMGEDPFLTGTMASNYIRAIQKNGVAACSKHFVANDIDKWRHFTSSNLDERTLREMHMLPFEMTVRDGGVWMIMTGNNLVNGVHAAQNKTVLQEIFKEQVGFDGVAITDWRGAYSTVDAAFGGTDITSGFCAYVFGDGNLLRAVQNGEVPMDLIDDKVRRVLRLYFRTGVIDENSRPKGEANTPKHHAIARSLAAEGMVLLKNEKKILPLNTAKTKSIFVTGAAADAAPAGTGSSKVDAEISITPLQGLKAAFKSSKITFFPYDKDKIDEMAAASKGHDIALFVASGGRSGESMDLQSLELPENQVEAIRKLSAVHKKVIVITLSAGPLEMQEWIDGPEAVMSCWFAGQATGEAIGDALSGAVNPGGKLSFTIGKKLDDYAPHALGEWPQKPLLDSPPRNAPANAQERVSIHGYDLNYSEGVFVGYRWFDKKALAPLFPFGYGLSYTTFKMENAGIEITSDKAGAPEVAVKVKVTNKGKKAGSEVVQVYVGDPQSSVERPKRELKGFAKVQLDPGETKEVSVKLDQRSFAFWSVEQNDWVVEPGDFSIDVGNSSRNIVFTEKATLK